MLTVIVIISLMKGERESHHSPFIIIRSKTNKICAHCLLRTGRWHVALRFLLVTQADRGETPCIFLFSEVAYPIWRHNRWEAMNMIKIMRFFYFRYIVDIEKENPLQGSSFFVAMPHAPKSSCRLTSSWPNFHVLEPKHVVVL